LQKAQVMQVLDFVKGNWDHFENSLLLLGSALQKKKKKKKKKNF